MAMPKSSEWLVRMSLLHFVAASTVGALLLARPALGFLWTLPATLHTETALVGFMLQFALGVAVWILPRPLASVGLPLQPAAWLLNGGVLCVVAGSWWPWLLLPGRLAEAAAVIILGAHVVPRVRALVAHTH